MRHHDPVEIVTIGGGLTASIPDWPLAPIPFGRLFEDTTRELGPHVSPQPSGSLSDVRPAPCGNVRSAWRCADRRVREHLPLAQRKRCASAASPSRRSC